MTAMKKRRIVYSVLYYCLVPAVFFGVLCLLSALLSAAKARDDLGTVVFAAYAFVFFAAPVIDAVMMRFSPLRFYIDPFAAAEIPFFLYLAMILNGLKSAAGVRSAFLLVNRRLTDDGGMGVLFLAGLFLFGALFSFSVKRKHGQSVAYRIIEKPSETRLENPGLPE